MSGLVHLDGVLAALDGEDDLAEEKLRSATASDPDNEPWAGQLAVFLAERGRLADAVEIIDEALKHVEDKTRLEQMRLRMKKEIADSE
jgi:Tfp pilus assembly protein PilF